MTTGQVFALPLRDKWLLYAPLHDLSALVNFAALEALRGRTRGEPPPELAEIKLILDQPRAEPKPRRGGFLPDFLGLLPTRECNLSCIYCGFRSGSASKGSMTPEQAIHYIDWYARRMKKAGRDVLEVHFFGGEPLLWPELVKTAVLAARIKAEEYGLRPKFEISTNGIADEETAVFVADFIDSIVLSIDGPADIHDRHRPWPDGSGSFEATFRSAKIFDDGPNGLHLRSCITSGTASRMEEIAEWFGREFRPSSVCFETLQPSPESLEAGLQPPDPWEFAVNFRKAAELLEKKGIETIYATSDISTRRVTFCPVGRDVAVVSPGGRVNGCYLLERDWQVRGMDLGLGEFSDDGTLCLDHGSVDRLRCLNVLNYRRCDGCFCRWHCAGGCHVNHSHPGCPQGYDDLCIQTRAITLYRILQSLDRKDLFDELLSDGTELRRTVLQDPDSL